MFKIIRGIIGGICLLFLAGCATQNIPLPDSFWQNPKQKITVVAAAPSTPTMYKEGPQGILDMGINDLVDISFTNYLKTMDLSWYGALQHSFASQLKLRHFNADTYSDYIPADQKDFSTLFAETNSDKILLIKLQQIGATREYYGFIPLGAPKAYCSLTGELIDLQNSKVIWLDQVAISQAIAGAWDQPPNYQNFMNTLNAVITAARQELLNDFFANH